MPNDPSSEIELQTKRRTVAKVYFILALGVVAGFVFAYFYLNPAQ